MCDQKHQQENYWLVYRLHLMVDVRYELPVSFVVRPENESENPHCKALVEQVLASQLGERCRSFVVDRGLDDDPLRRSLFRAQVLQVSETRRMWNK